MFWTDKLAQKNNNIEILLKKLLDLCFKYNHLMSLRIRVSNPVS